MTADLHALDFRNADFLIHVPKRRASEIMRYQIRKPGLIYGTLLATIVDGPRARRNSVPSARLCPTIRRFDHFAASSSRFFSIGWQFRVTQFELNTRLSADRAEWRSEQRPTSVC